MKKERKTVEEETAELMREIVRALRLMLRMYTWNTIFTFFSTIAGWVALLVVLLVWLM